MVTAENGEEALAALAVDAFDLVLMDIRMPVMDGLTATRALRASNGPNAKTPVLALSADVMAADLERCREAGMNGHVAKPISVKALSPPWPRPPPRPRPRPTARRKPGGRRRPFTPRSRFWIESVQNHRGRSNKSERG